MTEPKHLAKSQLRWQHAMTTTGTTDNDNELSYNYRIAVLEIHPPKHALELFR